MPNKLFYGDNIDILRNRIQDETVNLCYIDPPFNSKRDYNQIYNNIGTEDRAQAQAFTDTWTWDGVADAGLSEILANEQGRFQSNLVALIKGLDAVLGKGSLLAYLVSMSLRVTEIHRVLVRDGSFYLHCDPTSSHYLKILVDAIFLPQGGDFKNEIVWGYESGGRSKKDFGRKHDIILRYTKSKTWTFNADDILLARETARKNHMKKQMDEDGRVFWSIKSNGKVYKYYADEGVIPSDVWNDISHLQQKDPERLGYPTQKPEALMTRIIAASSNKGDVVLDAYCGCGTTVATAQTLDRQWIGIDITYQSIALILKRLSDRLGDDVADAVVLAGVPRDLASAKALALKKDDRLRKEFEKWAVLTYTMNRGVINDKKGADAGIDARAFFMTAKTDNAKIIFQVKSGKVQRNDIATLKGDMAREEAAMAILITLEEPSKPMIAEAKAAGTFHHEIMGRDYDRVSIVTIQQIVEGKERLQVPMSREVLAAAKRLESSTQLDLLS